MLKDIAGVYDRSGPFEKRIWKLLAFVGRYGHQPVNVAMRLTVRQLNQLAACVSDLVRDENEAHQAASD